MKRCIADGSVGFPHVRVGHRQASKKENPGHTVAGVLFLESRTKPELAADKGWINYRWPHSLEVRGRTAETGRGRQRIDIRGRHKSLW